MNKSIGLLKSLMKKNINNKHKTMEVNRSNRYSPTKKPKKQKFSISKLNQANFNSNIEKKKNLYQQSLQKLDKSNKHKSIQNIKNIDMNHFYKTNIFISNNIPNNFKNSQNNSKTINNSKNKNYNTSLQKKAGNKSYVDLFQNNMHNSNDYINMGAGRTISNSVYDKIYDFENNNNSNEYSKFMGEMNNIINVLVNYINIIKSEYEKIIIKKVQNKDKEIKKLQNDKKFLIKENKNLKYKIIEMFYCIKKYESNRDKNKDNFSFFIKQLIDENKYLRKSLDKTNNINKGYYNKLENDIYSHLLQKDLLLQEEKEGEEKANNNIEEIKDNNNPFKLNNDSSNSNNTMSKINHKRQKTQFKIGYPSLNENINIKNEDKNETNKKDGLIGYISIMNNNVKNKAKNSSQKNLLEIKNKSSNNIQNDQNLKKEKDKINDNENNNNSLSMSESTDSVVHNKDTSYNKSNENTNIDKENFNKKIEGLTYFPSDDKYIKRIEFTK